MATTRLSLSTVISRSQVLPSLPEVALSLNRLVQDPNVTGRAVATLIERDPAISAKVLRVVNGPLFGRANPVRDLNEAVGLLGHDALRSLVTSLSLVDSTAKVDSSLFDMRAFWTCSVVGASLFRSISQQSKAGDPELFYLIGLMRGIGRVVMAMNMPEETRTIITVATEFKLSFPDATRHILDSDDAKLGAWLAESWGMEKPVVEGIAGQYGGGSCDPRIPALVRLVEFLCHRKRLRVSGDCDHPIATPDDIRKLGLTAAGLEAVIRTLDDELTRARVLLAGAA